MRPETRRVGNGGGIPHLISIDQLGDEDISDIMARADSIRRDGPRQPTGARRAVASLFYQNSTRTRLGFQTAVGLLGHVNVDPGDIKGMRTAENGGESMADSIKNISRMVDLIVIRHSDENIQANLTSYSRCPIVNAGDGWNEHPTQGLIDLYAMRAKFGSLSGLRVANVGDPRARHVHSALKLLAREGIAELVLCMDHEDHLEESLGGILAEMRGRQTKVSVHRTLEPALCCDVATIAPVDITGVIKGAIGEQPRFEEDASHRLNVTAEKLGAAGSQTVIMHPLPRHSEICESVDDTPIHKDPIGVARNLRDRPPQERRRDLRVPIPPQEAQGPRRCGQAAPHGAALRAGRRPRLRRHHHRLEHRPPAPRARLLP